MGARILGQTKRGLSWAAVAGGAAVLLAVVLAGTAAAQGIPPGDGIGVQDPNTGRWTVRDTAGNLVPFLYGNPNDVPFMGDWDCDGVDTPGLFRPTDRPEGRAGKFYLRNTNTTGIADIEFFYGNPDDVPLVGDWDGNGCDSVGVWRPATGEFLLTNRMGRNNTGIGAAQIAFTLRPGDQPFSGDWNGDGVTGVGIRNDATGKVSLKNAPSAGPPDIQFFYGNPGDEPISGDWDGNPTETIGVYRPSEGRFYLKNSNTSSTANIVVTLGDPFWNGFAWSPTPDDTPPGAVDQTVTTDEDTPVSFTLDATDEDDDDELTYAVTSGPSRGTLSGTPPDLTYTPAPDFNGNDFFTYEVMDDVDDDDTASATVQIVVRPVNDAPVAVDDSYATNNLAPLAVNGVLDNDTDVDTGDTLAVGAVQGSAANVGNPTSTDEGGTVTVDPDGSFTYDPTTSASLQALAAGETQDDTFTYRADDGNGGTDTATVTITVTGGGGLIQILKRTDPPGGKGFGFTDDIAAPNSFNLNDGVIENFIAVDPGTYTVTEDDPAPGLGFDLTGLVCTEDGIADSSGDVATRTATINVETGETVRCTFTNTERGAIVVRKQTLPAGVADTFDFTGDVAGTIGSGGGIGVSNLPPGTYSSTEVVPAGWELTGIDCDDTDSSGDLGAATATFELQPGEVVTCIFTNTKDGSITVVKKTKPDGSAQTFDFTGAVAATLGDGDSTTVAVAPGTYSVDETQPTEWNHTLIVCNDGDSGQTGPASAQVVVAPGEDVICTFTNTEDALVNIVKQTVPPGGTGFGFTSSDVPPFTLDDGETAVFVGTGSPGTTTFTEDDPTPTGYDLTDITCTDSDPSGTPSAGDVPSGTATVNIDPGETITCTFTNTQRGTIVVEKQTLPDGDPQTFDFSGDAAGTIGDGQAISVDVPPATYTSTETVPAGWELTDITCDDGDSSGDTGTATATFVVDPGETVTCTFENTKDSTVEVVKDFVGTAGLVDLLVDGNVEATDQGDGGTTGPVVVAAGNHTAGEQAAGGTDLADYNSAFSCVEDSNGASPINGAGTTTGNIPVAEGDTWLCTFTNTRKTGTLEVRKEVVGNVGPVDLLIDGNVELADAEHFETTGPVTVDTGDHTASEQAGTGTDPNTYDTAFSCVEDTNGASPINGTGTATPPIPVEEGDEWECTFTNTRKVGMLEIVKDFVGTPGLVDLLVDGNVQVSDAGDGDTTFAMVLDTGDHVASEQAGTGTDLDDYNSAFSCVEDTNPASPINGPGTTTPGVPVEEGDDWVCTLTNTRKTGTIEVVKDFVGTPGLVDLLVDGNVEATDQGDGGTTGAVTVDTGSHTAGEQAGTATDLADYNTAWSCTNGGAPVAGSGTTTAAFTVAEGDAWVCTFTNTRKTGTVEVVKDFVGTPGVVDLLVDGNVEATDQGDGGTTGAVTVDTGSRTAGEQAGTGTDLADYNSSWSCTNVGAPVAGSGTTTAAFTVAEGDAWVCTFTNTRKQGSIEVAKALNPATDPGTFDLLIDGNVEATGGDGTTTGAVTLDTGSVDVEERGAGGTILGDYGTTHSCTEDTNGASPINGAGVGPVAVPVEEGDVWTCTFTNSANDPPEITSNGGGPTATITVDENQTAVTDVNATDDKDSEGSGLSYSLTDDDGPGPNGSDNGAFTIDANSGVLTFTSAPDFENPTDFDLGNDYEVQVTVTDSGPGPALTDHQNITVHVQDINDAPTLDLDLDNSGGGSPDFATSFTEGAGAVNLTDTDVDVDDQDGDSIVSATITLTNPQDGGAEELDSTTRSCTGITLAGTGGHVVTLTGSTTAANYEACLDDLTYENTSADPTVLPDRTVTIVVNDGTVDSNTTTTTIDIIPVNDPPTLTPPAAFDSLGNVGIDVPQASGLVGDATIVDLDWPGPFTVGAFDTTSANGGTVSVSADGSFTYDPAPGFEGADTFTYTVCDGGSPLPSQCSTAQTATVNVAEVIWFVDGDNGSDTTGDGSLGNPYASLTPLNNDGTDPDDPGDVIFVYDATGDYDVNDAGGFVLENDQQLIGEGAVGSGGDTVADEAGFTTPSHSNPLPAINGTAPTIGNGLGDVLMVGDGNTITGVDLDPTSSGGIVGSGFTGLAVSDVSIDTSGGTNDNDGVDLSSPAGTITFTDVAIASSGTNSGTAVDIDGAGGSADIDFLGSSSITQTEGALVDITNSASGASVIFGAGTTVASTDPTSTAFNLVNNGGATIGFDGGLSAVQTAGNSAAGLVISNVIGTPTVTVGGTTSILDVFGAPAFDAGDATLTGTFGRVASSGSPASGVRLQNIDGSVSIGNLPPGSSIIGASGTAFEVDGGTATVFFDGTIDNSTGFDVDVKNRPPGAGDVTFANEIGFAGPTTGLGISVTGNSAGQVAFNDRVRLSTGANTAVSLTGNGGAAVRFAGGLEITTTTGIGFQATGGGTIEVLSGGTTTVAVGSAPHAVDMNGVTIGLGDVSWDSINAASCSAACIDMDNVSSAGVFNGGAVDIDETTAGSPGIAIDGSSAAFNFTSATVDNTAGAGIDLNGANGTVTFTTVDIDGTGGAGLEVSGNTNTVLVDAGGIGASAPSTGDGVNVDAGSGAVTVDATIRQTGGSNSVDVRNRTGGTVTFNGAIDDDAAGVFLSANGGGTITFSGGMALDTGASTAFTATGGGTVNVTGTNTVGATTPLSTTAVNIANTNIGGLGVTFESIDVSSGAAGIVLNGTGTVPGSFFEVTGDGQSDPLNTTTGRTTDGVGATVITPGSGGTITGTTDGVVLTSTRDVRLRNMVIGDASAVPSQGVSTSASISDNGIESTNVTDLLLDNTLISETADHGIQGFGVNTGLTLRHSEIIDAGNDGSGPTDGDDAMDYKTGIGGPAGPHRLVGTVLIDTTFLVAMADTGLEVENTGGDLDLTVTNSLIGRNHHSVAGCAPCEGDGFLLRADGGSATIDMVVRDTVFDAVANDGIDIGNDQASNVSTLIAEGLSGTANSNADNLIDVANTSGTFRVRITDVDSDAAHRGTVLFFKADGAATTDVTVNTSGATGNTIAGSAIGRGIEVFIDGDPGTGQTDGNARVHIRNTDISNHFDAGVWLLVQDMLTGSAAAGFLDVTLDDVTMDQPTRGDNVIVGSLEVIAGGGGNGTLQLHKLNSDTGDGSLFFGSSTEGLVLRGDRVVDVACADDGNAGNGTPCTNIGTTTSNDALIADVKNENNNTNNGAAYVGADVFTGGALRSGAGTVGIIDPAEVTLPTLP